MLIGIGDLEWKRVNKCKSMPRVTIHRRPKISDLGMQIVQTGGEKDPMPFAKVVEECEIYNFPIIHLVHFC
jgi:hypothetical protein